MTLELRHFDESYYNEIFLLFSDKQFYFKSKRPDTLTEGQIKAILNSFNKDILLMLEDDELKGIVAWEEDAENNALVLNIRHENMNRLIEIHEEFYKLLKEFIKEYGVIKIKTYSFDDLAKRFCERSGLNAEAILRHHVFKNGRYHDIIVYSKIVI